jgi:hypothetical protein
MQPMDLSLTLRKWPGLFERFDKMITAERAAAWFSKIADTHAPSQTARYTRGPVLRDLLRKAGEIEGLSVHQNLWKTGNVAIALGSQPGKPFWMLAHLDGISYALGFREADRYRLLPLCYHMSRTGRQQAVALGYAPEHGGLRILAAGEIVTENDGSDIFFETSIDDLPKGTRVVYHYPAVVNWETRSVYGNIDNAFGCTALLLAASVLGSYHPNVLIVFPDEEEGQTGGGNQSFCKGSARLFNRCPRNQLPESVLVCDVHESKDMLDGPGSRSAKSGGGATFCELSSRGRGGVTPPPLVSFHRDLARALALHGVRLQENMDGYVSRSDSISAMMYVQNIALVGYLGSHRHFDGIPEAHLNDLVDLAKVLAVYALIAQSAEWRQDYLR